MSIKYPKNVVVGVSVVAALLAATVLFGGFAGSQATNAEAPEKVGCCPVTSKVGTCPKMAAAKAESTDCTKTPCTEGCPKPCCAGEDTEGVCDNPCPIPCPKPCCAEDAPKGCCGTTEAKGCCPAEAATQ